MYTFLPWLLQIALLLTELQFKKLLMLIWSKFSCRINLVLANQQKSDHGWLLCKVTTEYKAWANSKKAVSAAARLNTSDFYTVKSSYMLLTWVLQYSAELSWFWV